MTQLWRIHLPMQEMQEAQVPSLGQEDPLEEEMATHSSFLAWREAWPATVYRITKSQTRLSSWALTHSAEQLDPITAAPPPTHMLQVEVWVWLVGWFLDKLLVIYISWVHCLSSRMFPTWPQDSCLLHFISKELILLQVLAGELFLKVASHKVHCSPRSLRGNQESLKVKTFLPSDLRVKVHQPRKS